MPRGKAICISLSDWICITAILVRARYRFIVFLFTLMRFIFLIGYTYIGTHNCVCTHVVMLQFSSWKIVLGTHFIVVVITFIFDINTVPIESLQFQLFTNAMLLANLKPALYRCSLYRLSLRPVSDRQIASPRRVIPGLCRVSPRAPVSWGSGRPPLRSGRRLTWVGRRPERPGADPSPALLRAAHWVAAPDP